MGTLKSFLDSKGITEKQLIHVSGRLETFGDADRALMVKRAEKRRNKELAAKKYAELELAKPKAMGRPLTSLQLSAAVADKPVARKVRSKILRAVNHVLSKKSQPAADMKALFEGTKARVGKKVEEKK